jgi:hypothetical protein
VSRKAFFSNTLCGIDKMLRAFNGLLGAKKLPTMFLAHLANVKGGTKSLEGLLKELELAFVAHFSKVPRI